MDKRRLHENRQVPYKERASEKCIWCLTWRTNCSVLRMASRKDSSEINVRGSWSWPPGSETAPMKNCCCLQREKRHCKYLHGA